MKKTLLKIVLSLGLGLLSTQLFAVNLLQVYQQALNNDPTFMMAHSQWLSEKENIAINRAGLLPTFEVDGTYNRFYNNTQSFKTATLPTGATAVTVGRLRYRHDVSGYQLTLQQPIVNYQNWALLSQAKANEKQYAAQYSAAAQDLMYRTAEAYFNVLEAQDILSYTTAEKIAYKSQYDQTRERYKVGLATITDVQQAKASYDGAVAQEIQDRNSVDVEKEKLREITNTSYTSFAVLSKKLPLLYPNPANINQWVDVAQTQNYSLLAARYGVETARDNIHVQAAGHLPVLNAQGQYQYSHDDDYVDTGLRANNHIETLGLDLSLPIYEGGAVTAATKQAQYDYQYAVDNMDKTHRSVVSDTRQQYWNVVSGVNVIKADKQAVISARSSLESTIEGYKVGTQTMTDVLTQESNLYQSLKNYTTSQYDYLIATIALKQSTGTLGVNDLEDINSWLVHSNGIVPKPKAAKKSKKTTKKTRVPTRGTKANPNHYTLQLMASQNRQELVDYINKHKVANAKIITTCKNKQKWYELTVGKYASKNAANVALAKMPANIQNLKPWVRSYGSLQQTQC